ncbi:MAG: hypothetical protein K8S23_01920 [Candidatus Cloacimonetes bacterium]|nr:hypothetical protein [Candidatus Cloacimonadota bacterium]
MENNNSKDNFTNELMKEIIEGIKIPKVQVERAVTPILSLFIESVLNKYFESDKSYAGLYKLVTQEFPLKKIDNNQSTNIDYLLVNTSKQLVVLFEIKTDVSSFDSKQLKRYLEYKEIISNNSLKILKDNLSSIRDASSKSSKYDYIISKFESAIIDPNVIKDVLIIYLVPHALKKHINDEYSSVDYVLEYSDLPKIINHTYSNHWIVVRENLIKLDVFFHRKLQVTQKGDSIVIVVQNIKNYLKNIKNICNPISLRLGITGDGSKPNYQVKFDDGTIKTFRFSGKPHSVEVFNSTNLSKEYLWSKIKEKA